MQNIHREKLELLDAEIESLRVELAELKEEVRDLDEVNTNILGKVAEQVLRIHELESYVRSFESWNASEHRDWKKLNEHLDSVIASNKALTLLLMENDVMIPPEQLELHVEPRKSAFRVGEQVGFDIWSIVPLMGSTFTIWDSNGSVVWELDPLNTWQHDDPFWIVLYGDQTCNQKEMWLYENATLGQYTWMYLHNKQAYAQGEFTVRPPI